MKLLCAWLFLSITPLPGLGICPDRLVFEAEPTARLGILVKSQDQVLVDINGNQAFIPASVQKLFTTAVALNSLGPRFRVKTVLTMSPEGELRLTGGGDPSFSSDRDLPQLVRQLERGTTPIKNILIEQESWGNAYGRGWEWADTQAPYAPPIGGVVIDENILEWSLEPGFNWKHPSRARGWQVKNNVQLGQSDSLEIQTHGQTIVLRGTIPAPLTDAIPIPDPGAQFVMLLRSELAKQGLNYLKPSQALVFSPPLKDLVKITNKDSHNLYGEQILRILGREQNRSGLDYETRGREIITQAVNSPGFYVADGSGLSRHNQATPKQIVELLERMAENSEFRASLPIGGKDGTLRNRLKHLNIQAKTGTLTGVGTLAGYLTPSQHPPVVFAILVNHSLLSPQQLRTKIDRMVEQINQLTPCEP